MYPDTECPYLKTAAKRERELPMGFLTSLYHVLCSRLRSVSFGGWARNFEKSNITFSCRYDGLIIVEVLIYQTEPNDRKKWRITKEHKQQIIGLAEPLLERVLRLILKKAKNFKVEKIAVALRYEDHLTRVYRFRVERYSRGGAR